MQEPYVGQNKRTCKIIAKIHARKFQRIAVFWPFAAQNIGHKAAMFKLANNLGQKKQRALVRLVVRELDLAFTPVYAPDQPSVQQVCCVGYAQTMLVLQMVDQACAQIARCGQETFVKIPCCTIKFMKIVVVFLHPVPHSFVGFQWGGAG